MRKLAVVILLLAVLPLCGKDKKVTALALNFTNHGTGPAHITWALPQDLATSPTSVNFGNVAVGQVSAPFTITLSTISGIAFGAFAMGGPNATEFSFTNACPVILNANKNCSLTVTLAPKTLGPKSASLTVGFAGLIPGAPSNLHIIISQITTIEKEKI